MKIEYHVDPDKQCKRFIVEGELDVHHVKTLKSQVMDALEEGAWVYRIDMADIGYLDSSGLGMLVFLKKEVLRHGGVLYIDNLRETVLNVFRLTKLDEFFNLSPTDGNVPGGRPQDGSRNQACHPWRACDAAPSMAGRSAGLQPRRTAPKGGLGQCKPAARMTRGIRTQPKTRS